MSSQPDLKMISHQIEIWTSGIDFEKQFWDNWMATSGSLWPKEFEARTNPDAPLAEIIENACSSMDRKRFSVLDVGAGPLTSIGYKSRSFEVDIIAVDPLAGFYQKLYNKIGLCPPISTSFAIAEDLNAFFAPEMFDVVHCRNALDHSFDPLRGIQQMIDVTAVGGVVILSHHNDEAENGKYEGFHQFNFNVHDGSFFIWNPDVEINVSEFLADEAVRIECENGDTGHNVWIWKQGHTKPFGSGDFRERLARFQEGVFLFLTK
jgi:SAM-dependent methyltransferase